VAGFWQCMFLSCSFGCVASFVHFAGAGNSQYGWKRSVLPQACGQRGDIVRCAPEHPRTGESHTSLEAIGEQRSPTRLGMERKPGNLAAPKKRKRTAQFLPPPACRKEEFERTLPYRPRCADDFKLGAYPVRREITLSYRYVQYNTPSRPCWLISGIDHAGKTRCSKIHPTGRCRHDGRRLGRPYVGEARELCLEPVRRPPP
jgi:hypothetical protein